MANSARIDELEKKFSENARRYFAPLANEYRKAGDLERAIEICRAHLPQQPGHMSGHVVYGQALYESRQLEEAKSVFEAALGLDPENLIALRHLGDIARDSGDPSTARTWYMRVLDADPRNDEVAAMLAELDSAVATAPPTEAPAEPSDAGAVSWGDINPEAAKDADAGATEAGDASAADEAEEEPAEAAAPDTARERAENRDDSSAASRPTEAEAPDAALFAKGGAQPQGDSLDQMLNEAFAAEADTQEMEAAAPTRGASKAKDPSPPAPAASEVDDETFAEVDALFDEISPPRQTGSQKAVTGSHAAQPSPSQPAKDSVAADALFGDDAAPPSEGEKKGAEVDGLETAEFMTPTRATPEKAPRRDTGSMAVAGLTSFDQPTDEDSSTRAAFVTETMAELYLQQGFTDEALDIYKQLLAKNPGDASLRDRVDQLERGGGTSLSVAAVSSEVIEAAKQRHAARPQRTVRSFFGRLAGRRPPQRAEHNEPSNGGDRYGSLSSAPDDERLDESRVSESSEPLVRIDLVNNLFGDADVNDADEQAASTLASGFAAAMFGDQEPAPTTPTPIASPQAPTGRAAHTGGNELSLDQVFRESAPRNPRKSGAYSFEQFFSDGTPTSGGTAAGAQPPSEESSDNPEGDLEQFTAWLEGLKRK